MQSLSYTRLQIFYLLLINLPHLRSILNYFAARNPIPLGNLGSKIRSHSSQCSDDRKYGNVKWRVVLKQRFAPDHCVIARLSRGARAGPGWTRGSEANPHGAFWTLWAPIFTVSPAVHSEPQIKSETLYRAGSTTEQVSNMSINEQHKRTASISTEKNQKFDKWQHAWYVFIRSYFKTQILQSIITHLPFNTPVIPFCPA